MRQRFWFFMLLVIIGESARAEDTTAIAAKSPPTVHDIGSRRELFVVDAFDSQNLAFWDSVRGEYRAY